MKITKIETLCLTRMHEPERQWETAAIRAIKADCAIVVIHTDAGITGIGEACAYGVPDRIKDWGNFLSPLLVGADPLDPAIAPVPHYRNSSYDCAVAGIDCALWDIRGKATGKRVCDLLVGAGLSNGPALSKVRLYASSGCRYDWRVNPHQLIDEALGYIEQGYTAMKLRIGTEWTSDDVTPERFIGLMRELTQAVRATGKQFDLAVDGNQRLNEAQAMQIAKVLDELGFAWFEEPIPQVQVDGYARIAASVDIPITGGEQFTTLEQFRPYLERKAYDIVQPDMGWCGLSEGLRIAQYAERFGVRVMPHSWHNGLMLMANAHYVAALPRPYMCEICMIQGPLLMGILKTAPHIQSGILDLADIPGLGVDIADNLEAKFPYLSGSWALPVQRTDELR